MNHQLLNDLASVAGLIVAIATLVGGAAATMRWLNQRQSEQIIRQIREATYQISPSANGGLSLADVARKTNEIQTDLSEMKGKVDVLIDLYSKEK